MITLFEFILLALIFIPLLMIFGEKCGWGKGKIDNVGYLGASPKKPKN